MSNLNDPQNKNGARQHDMRSRNVAMFWMLMALAALFYGISVVKLGDTLKKGRSIDRFAQISPLGDARAAILHERTA